MDANLNLSADVSESANALLKEPAKSAGGVGSTIIDFFHNTLLYPL